MPLSEVGIKVQEKVLRGRPPIYSALLSMHRNKDPNSDIELIRR